MNAFRLLLAASVFAIALPAMAEESLTCSGKFPNPATDICWSCILPITVGGATLGDLDAQEDIENPTNPVCSCTVNPMIGISIGFWEPARHAEVVRKPFCLVSLGGVDLDPGIAAPEAGRFTRAEGDGDGGSFYQAHFYANPVLYYLDVVTDFPCLEPGSFDLAYLTEVDPLWADDELTLIVNPDAALFANPVAIAACAADCVAASAGFGIPDLFWCAGCQGGLYPMNGRVPFHMGGVRTSALIAQRLTTKMHRELIAWSA
ncbi:MAG: TraU family protein, partial [Azoarcus sp.]|nr:TraU family protein [Azoarcus sp.]